MRKFFIFVILYAVAAQEGKFSSLYRTFLANIFWITLIFFGGLGSLFKSVYKNDQIRDFFRNWFFLFWIDFYRYWYRGLKSNLELKNSFPSKLELDAVSAKLAVTCLVNKCYVQGWKCWKINFYWVIASPKHDCVVVEWNLGFNEKYFKFHFGH